MPRLALFLLPALALLAACSTSTDTSDLEDRIEALEEASAAAAVDGEEAEADQRATAERIDALEARAEAIEPEMAARA